MAGVIGQGVTCTALSGKTSCPTSNNPPAPTFSGSFSQYGNNPTCPRNTSTSTILFMSNACMNLGGYSTSFNCSNGQLIENLYFSSPTCTGISDASASIPVSTCYDEDTNYIQALCGGNVIPSPT